MASHPIVHIEFPSKDPAAAGEFYSSLFGWQITTDDQLQYVMFGAEGGPGGGFPLPQEGSKAGVPIVYVHTDDIDATLAKAQSLGGSVVSPKFEVPGVGWLGFFLDPSGTVMGLFTSAPGS